MSSQQPDKDPLAEGYHVLGQLNEGLQDAESELRQLRDRAAAEHADLLKQLEEAQRMGDEASLERLPTLIEQAQQAWIVANEELQSSEQEDQPPTEEDEDDPEHGTSSALSPEHGGRGGDQQAPR